MFNLLVKEEAHIDIAEAYNYYEAKQTGLGERFLSSLLKRYTDLSKHPYNYSFIHEDEALHLRDVLLNRFPYVIVFEIIENDVIIYAVHNTYKSPAKKLQNK